jgi:hypothetical protein
MESSLRCKQCNQIIGINTPIYRAYDSTMCSISCRNRRCEYIDLIDPFITNPNTWNIPYTRSEIQQQCNLNQTLINQSTDYITLTKHSHLSKYTPISNTNTPHTSKKPTKYTNLSEYNNTGTKTQKTYTNRSIYNYICIIYYSFKYLSFGLYSTCKLF